MVNAGLVERRQDHQVVVREGLQLLEGIYYAPPFNAPALAHKCHASPAR